MLEQLLQNHFSIEDILFKLNMINGTPFFFNTSQGSFDILFESVVVFGYNSDILI